MYIGIIAWRYAKALDAFAVENGEEQITYEQIRLLTKLYAKDKTLREILLSPVLSPDVKVGVIRKLFEGGCCHTLERFVKLVIDHRREEFLWYMFHSFTTIYKKRNGILDATLTTAKPVDDDLRARLSRLAETITHSKEVKIHREVDPSLIGGFIIRQDDTLIDASIRNQIARIARQMGGRKKRIV